MSRRLALLVNPVSAGGRPLKVLPAVRAELDRLGAGYRVVETRSLEHAKEEALGAAQAGETVVAIGGDGLIGPIAGELRGAEAPLAMVPGGRGNDFARVLGVPRDPAEAARIAVEGRERLVDVAEANGKPYVGIASLGFDSDANRIANEARFIRGNLVYLYAAVRALVAWRPATFSVTVDGESHAIAGYGAGAGNSKAYGGGMLLFPHAELDDGLLDVLAMTDHPKLRFLTRTLPGAFKGTLWGSPQARVFRGAVVEMDADRPFVVYADGDPITRTPVTMRVRQRCLRVLVPR